MRFCLLASGSKGNCLWIEEGGVAIIIDNGLSLSELKSRVKKRNLDFKSLAAVFLTHEHSDHMSGVGVLCRAYGLTLHTSPLTLNAAYDGIGKVDFSPIVSGETVKIGPLVVSAFSSSHDSVDSQVYVIRGSNSSLGMATDLGVVTHLVRQNFLSLTALVLEFNHDLKMLLKGPYPLFLKQRVRSRRGHLSNADASVFLSQVNHSGLKLVVLSHLSETNNDPLLALSAAKEAISKGPGKPKIQAANQWEPTPVFEI
jgi:phosphoribosyl 1,2-cyclic phosphodiesterase